MMKFAIIAGGILLTAVPLPPSDTEPLAVPEIE
jgi:hypothetical protein